MGKQPVEKVIEGDTYTFYMLPPRVSVVVLIKLTKIIGPALGAAFPKDKTIKIKDILDMDINIGDAINMLVEKIDATETQNIIDIIFENTLCKGRGKLIDEAVYTELFTGNIKLLFTILKEGLGVQYGNFFAGSNVLEELRKA